MKEIGKIVSAFLSMILSINLTCPHCGHRVVKAGFTGQKIKKQLYICQRCWKSTVYPVKKLTIRGKKENRKQ